MVISKIQFGKTAAFILGVVTLSWITYSGKNYVFSSPVEKLVGAGAEVPTPQAALPANSGMSDLERRTSSLNQSSLWKLQP